MSDPLTVYDLVGREKFEQLVEAFYRGVEEDPLLRPLYPDEALDGAKERLTLFLIQYWDGPREYEALRGHPRLRMRHHPFAVGAAERDAWLHHMLAAVDEVGIQEPARTLMIDYFRNTAQFLVNRPGD